jgi:glycosyltransferase involved in cell wall biosynthesis
MIPRMNVALDGTPLSMPTGGIVRYTAELSRALAENFPEDNYWFISDQPFSMPTEEFRNLNRGIGPRHALERRWWTWGIQTAMIRLGIEVFHGTDFAVPYVPLRPSVLTLHDLSPWKDPAWHRGAERVRWRSPYLLGLGLATMIVTPSESVRRESVEHFRNIHPGKVITVPLAASSHFRPVAGPPRRAPYFLYTGTLEPRKNIPLLVEAWKEVRSQHEVDLVLAGRRREDFPELPALAGLHVLGPVPEAELPQLYSGAVAFLYPSFYEGFGLPVLEAMRCGAAVITTRGGAVGEVVGGAAVRLDARDVREWVGAMTIALTQPEWLCEWRRRALARSEEFSWARTARLTREVYDEAKQRFGR